MGFYRVRSKALMQQDQPFTCGFAALIDGKAEL
jgi:hypothetical protein